MRRLIAWLPVAVVAAWALVRLLGLERGYPLIPLVAYTPVVAVAAVVVVALAALLRQWAAAAVAAGLAVALVGVVAPRALGGPSRAAGRSGPTVGVLSVNLQLAGADPEAVVALVRRTGAELLSLQEVDAGAVRALDRAGLGRLMPERVVRLGRATSGTALYARVPLRALPPPQGTFNPLAVAAMTVEGAAPVEVTAIHPPAPVRHRISTWQRDVRQLPPATPRGRVRLLVGDFNATLDHAGLRRLLDTGYEDAADQVGAGLRPTWPVGRRFPPPVTIDHVLADSRCGFAGYSLHTIPRSDHRAVHAELVLPAG